MTHAHRTRIPAEYERRQTLTGAERYVTPELKEYESKVLSAEERLPERESELFTGLRVRVGEQIARIQGTSGVLSRLDVWTGLAQVAELERYVRPAVDDGFDLELVASRHPVLERLMARESFMPNDVRFTSAERVAVTGPNMAGKSTILRQIGLCVVLAQLGLVRARGFGPHRRGRPAFTRVGASDNLAQGQSTFMVEMSETSDPPQRHGPEPRAAR